MFSGDKCTIVTSRERDEGGIRRNWIERDRSKGKERKAKATEQEKKKRKKKYNFSGRPGAWCVVPRAWSAVEDDSSRKEDGKGVDGEENRRGGR